MSSSPIPPFPVDRPPLDGDVSVGARLEEAFVSERTRLLRYLERRAGAEAAPDLVQEVFVRAFGSAQARRLVNPAAFLQRIARNLLIDRARKRARDNVVFFPFEDERDAATPAEQEWGIEVVELQKLYESAIDGLPAKTRRVFLMHRVDELSYREIHSQLGISIATVEYHMIKALAHIARTVDAGR